MLSSNATVLYDASNNALSGATGAAVPAGALQAAGSDGTNLRALLLDSGGRQRIVGAAAAGAAPVSDPVYVGGSDGTNVQSLRTDTSGRQIIVGAAADGAAPVGNPVLIAGSDGTNVQTLLTDTLGNLKVTSTTATAGTATLANVAASVTSVTLLAANANRLGAIIVNDGNAVLFAKFGATASSTSFTARIPAGGYYEVPFGYTGLIDGIWTVANGAARTTELTA